MAEESTPQSLCANPEPFYAITDRLSTWGMMDWLTVIARWLARYRGIEALLSCRAQHPAQAILDLLNSFSAPPNDEALAQQLSRLEFLLWRISRADESAKRWNPLALTLCQYLDGDPPITWQWDEEYPTAAETAAWLLNELAQVRKTHPRPT